MVARKTNSESLTYGDSRQDVLRKKCEEVGTSVKVGAAKKNLGAATRQALESGTEVFEEGRWFGKI